ncbi:MAG: hypothetical protein RL087_41 [Pseudomonadota bacterium]
MLQHLPAEARPREKLLARGPAALSDAELLALVLRTGVTGQPVLALAQQLIDDFGGLSGLLHTDASDLKRVRGLGGNAKRAIGERLRERAALGSPDAVKQYLQLHLGQRTHKVFAVMFLDTQNRLIALEELFRGTLTQTSVYPREVAVRALHHHAAAVVLAHNHPSGAVQPSRADEALTQSLKAALALLDVRVLDHIIVAPGQALSFAERGLL